MESSSPNTIESRLGDERLRVLTAAARTFAETTADYDSLLNAIARGTAEVLKNTCTVQLLTIDRSGLEPVALAASDPAVLGRLRSLLSAEPIRLEGHALYRKVIETGEALLVPRIDLSAHAQQASAAHAGITSSLGMHSGLMVALRVRGESIGALSMGRYEGHLPPFDEQDRDLAQTLADHAALAITNARLLKSIQRELEERNRAELALQKSQDQLRQVQKMEAIGSLAGGVAHDFNNILSVVLSYSELLIAALKPGDPMRADLEEIRGAGLRATSRGSSWRSGGNRSSSPSPRT